MVRAFLFGFSALALASAAGTAAAKAPTCRDAKGHAVPCPGAHAPDPAPTISDGACLWLIAHGILAPCTLL